MFLKDAQAEVDYRVDWAAAVGVGSEIVASVWTVLPEEAGGLAVVADWKNGATARVRLGGGVPGHVYHVGNRVTLADASVDERSLAIRVEER